MSNEVSKVGFFKWLAGKAVAPVAITAAGLGGLHLHHQSQVEQLRNEATEGKTAMTKHLEDQKASYTKMLANESSQRLVEKGARTIYQMETEQKFMEYQGLISKLSADKKALEEELAGLKGTSKDLSGRITVVEEHQGMVTKRVEDTGLKLGKLETEVKDVSTKTANIKTDEAKRLKALEKTLPNVVSLTIYNKAGKYVGSLMGFVVKDKKNEYYIATAGHGWTSEEKFLESIVEVSFFNGLFVKNLNPTKFPNDVTPWSSAYIGRDIAVLRLPPNIQLALQKSKLEGINIKSAKSPFFPGSGLNLVKSGWSVASGTITGAAPHWRDWTKRRDIVTDALIKRGDSGGVAVDNEGYLVGMLVERKEPDTSVTTPDGKQVPLKVEVGDVNTGGNFLISYLDIQRALRSFGVDMFNKEDRNILLKQDILKDRPYMLVPLLPGPGLTGGVLPFLHELSRLDRYALMPPPQKK
ncbi:MAG: trypsin-like peptidase domain-containing protein [Candidatus Melainabacteria bacterium]|nr:trypsin-like peptidase domain-containing protein [Candidatus Melainabacteria bacterium]